MSDLVLDNITNPSRVSVMNDNFKKIEDKVNEDVLQNKDGHNTMLQDLDMDSNQILNLPKAVNDTDPVRLIDLEEITGLGPYTIPIGNGGTGATTASGARGNLGVDSSSEVDAKVAVVDAKAEKNKQDIALIKEIDGVGESFQTRQAVEALYKAQGYNNVFFFEDGFTYTDSNDVGIYEDGTAWTYADAGALPVTITAGTVPSEGVYNRVKLGVKLSSEKYGMVADGDIRTGAGTNNRDALQRMLDDATDNCLIEIGNASGGVNTYVIDGELTLNGVFGVRIVPLGSVEILHINGSFTITSCPKFNMSGGFSLRGLAKDVYDARQGSNRNTYALSLYNSGGASGGVRLIKCPQSNISGNDFSYFRQAITSDGSYVSWFMNNRFNHNRVSILPIRKTTYSNGELVNDHQIITGNVFGNHYEGHCISSRYLENELSTDTPVMVEETASNTVVVGINQFETYSGSGLDIVDHPYDIYIDDSATTRIDGPTMVVGGGIYVKGIRTKVHNVIQYDIATPTGITLVGGGVVKSCEQYFSKNTGGNSFENAYGKVGVEVKDGLHIVEGIDTSSGNGVLCSNANNSIIKNNDFNCSDEYCVGNLAGTGGQSKIKVTGNNFRTFDSATYYKIDIDTANPGLVKSFGNTFDSRDLEGGVTGLNPNRIMFNETNVNSISTTIPGNNELRPLNKVVKVTAAANIIIDVHTPTGGDIDTLFDEVFVFFDTSAQVDVVGNIKNKTGSLVNILPNTGAVFRRYDDNSWYMDY